MKAKWHPPGKLTEPAGDQLAAFGVKTLPGARLNMVDPPDLWGQMVETGKTRQDIPRTVAPPTVEGIRPTVRNPYMEDSVQGLEEEAEANRKEQKKERDRERKNKEQSL